MHQLSKSGGSERDAESGNLILRLWGLLEMEN